MKCIFSAAKFHSLYATVLTSHNSSIVLKVSINPSPNLPSFLPSFFLSFCLSRFDPLQDRPPSCVACRTTLKSTEGVEEERRLIHDRHVVKGFLNRETQDGHHTDAPVLDLLLLSLLLSC